MTFKIRKGVKLRDKRSGQLLVIQQKHRSRWLCYYPARRNRNSHTMAENTLRKYYEPLPKGA